MQMKQGFTLLELSIVLVIIGLIIGGITVGSDLIRAAELNSVISDYNKYQVALRTFDLKYNSIPGDMSNATDYWGAAHANTTTCKTTVGTGKQTCDGNGDGEIGNATSEVLRSWQHLANAELISGSYTGVSGPGHATLHAIIDENVPAGKISGTGWALRYINHTNPASTLYVRSAYILEYGSDADSDWIHGKALSPSEMKNIDDKLDDGKPGKGKVTSAYRSNCTDASSSTDYEADYALATDGPQCAIHFILD